MGRGPNDHRRTCIAALVKIGAHLVIDATALNEIRSGINLIHDAAVMRNVSGILDLPEAAAASNRMLGAGVTKVTERSGLGEFVSGVARDLDVDDRPRSGGHSDPAKPWLDALGLPPRGIDRYRWFRCDQGVPMNNPAIVGNSGSTKGCR
jgi:hypothetical protein